MSAVTAGFCSIRVCRRRLTKHFIDLAPQDDIGPTKSTAYTCGRWCVSLRLPSLPFIPLRHCTTSSNPLSHPPPPHLLSHSSTSHAGVWGIDHVQKEHSPILPSLESRGRPLASLSPVRHARLADTQWLSHLRSTTKQQCVGDARELKGKVQSLNPPGPTANPESP